MEAFILILLGLSSIVGLAFIVERGLALRWKTVIPPAIRTALEGVEKESDLARLRQACEQNPSPAGRLLLSADRHRDWTRKENSESLETMARHEMVKLERGLVVLEILVGIAPLLGLVGTIYGLISLFGSFGTAGMGDNSGVLAKGISIALNATLAGLLTAIPSLVAWSYFNKKVEALAVELETVCEEFLRRTYRRNSHKDQDKDKAAR